MANFNLSLDSVMEDWGGMTAASSPDGKGIFSMSAWMTPSAATDFESNNSNPSLGKELDTTIEFVHDESAPTPAMEVVFDYSSDGCHELIYEDIPPYEPSPTSVMDAFFPMDQEKSDGEIATPSIAATESSSSSDEHGVFHNQASQQHEIVHIPTDDVIIAKNPESTCSKMNTPISFFCTMPLTQEAHDKNEARISNEESHQSSLSRPILERSFCYGPCGFRTTEDEDKSLHNNLDIYIKESQVENLFDEHDVKQNASYSNSGYLTAVPKFITTKASETKDPEGSHGDSNKVSQQVYRYLVKARPYYEPSGMTEQLLLQMKKSRVCKNAALEEMLACFDEALQFDLSGSSSFIGRSRHIERARTQKAACIAELAECFRKVNEMRDQGTINVKLTFTPSQSEESDDAYEDCASFPEIIAKSVTGSNDDSDGTSFFDANDAYHSDEGMAWQEHASQMHSVKVELLRNEIFQSKRLKKSCLSELEKFYRTTCMEQTMSSSETSHENVSDEAFVNELFSFIDHVYFPESIHNKMKPQDSKTKLHCDKKKESQEIICTREIFKVLLGAIHKDKSLQKQSVLILQRNVRRFISRNRRQMILGVIIKIQRTWRLHQHGKINKLLLKEKIERERSLEEARRSQYQLNIKRALLKEAVYRQNLEQMKDRCMAELQAKVPRNLMIMDVTKRLKSQCLSQMLNHVFQEKNSRDRKYACLDELRHFIAEASHNEEYWIKGESVPFVEKDDNLSSPNVGAEEEIIFYDAVSEETPPVSYANEVLGIDILQWFDQVHGEIMASLAKDAPNESKEKENDDGEEIIEMASSASSFDFLTKNRLSTIDEGDDESVKTEVIESQMKAVSLSNSKQSLVSETLEEEAWVGSLPLLHKSLDLVDMSCFTIHRKVENHTFKFKA